MSGGQKDTDKQAQTDTDRHRQTQKDTERHRQTQTDTDTNNYTDTDLGNEHRHRTEHGYRQNRQIIVNIPVLQLQIVCENLDCLQVWLEQIELIWSPDWRTPPQSVETNFSDERIQI